jgi:hypothetical protein
MPTQRIANDSKYVFNSKGWLGKQGSAITAALIPRIGEGS